MNDKIDSPSASPRLQVFLARAGIASRRACEAFIAEGRVSVNGCVVTTPGTKVAAGDDVRFDGSLVTPEAALHYQAMHKPPLYLCTQRDPQNRPLARSLLPVELRERLYTIGRLDYRSSGLILWTNDGNFAAALGHPSSNIEKEYFVEAASPVPEALLDAFLEGITIDDVRYRCHAIEKTGRSTLRIVLMEGKNREIRRVFSHFHLHAEVLRRVRIGPVLLDGLPEGKTRTLSGEEMHALSLAAKRRLQPAAAHD